MNIDIKSICCTKNPFPKCIPQNIKLYDDGIDEKCIRNGRPWIILDECHRKTKSNKNDCIKILIYRIGVCESSRAVLRQWPDEDAINDDNDEFYSYE